MQRTKRTVKPEKLQAVQSVEKLLKESKTIAISNLHKVRGAQLMGLRKSLRNQLRVKVAKNSFVKLALAGSGIKNHERLIEEIKGQKALMFTDLNPFKLYLLLERGKINLPARAGDIATDTITIPAGNTGIPPGPVLSEFKAVKVPTRIETGSIFVSRDTVVATRGDEISLQVGALLSKLDMKPIKAGVAIDLAYVDGLVFSADDIAIDLDQYRAELTEAARSGITLGVEMAYFSLETTPQLLGRGFRDARGLSVSSGFLTTETTSEALMVTHQNALSLQEALSKKGYS
ncbi:MAG: 50S ribosomal protein L10 [Nitrososphaerales archaeon]